VSRTIKLNNIQVANVSATGPYPFNCVFGRVTWPEHTDEQVIEYLERNHRSFTKDIVIKLKEHPHTVDL
jgi:hypothetical protein